MQEHIFALRPQDNYCCCLELQIQMAQLASYSEGQSSCSQWDILLRCKL